MLPGMLQPGNVSLLDILVTLTQNTWLFSLLTGELQWQQLMLQGMLQPGHVSLLDMLLTMMRDWRTVQLPFLAQCS